MENSPEKKLTIFFQHYDFPDIYSFYCKPRVWKVQKTEILPNLESVPEHVTLT